MSKKDTKPVKDEGELSDQQLDQIAGGQEVVKMGTIVVEAKREPREKQEVVKMGTITVSAKRDKPEATTTLAAATPTGKKN